MRAEEAFGGLFWASSKVNLGIITEFTTDSLLTINHSSPLLNLKRFHDLSEKFAIDGIQPNEHGQHDEQTHLFSSIASRISIWTFSKAVSV